MVREKFVRLVVNAVRFQIAVMLCLLLLPHAGTAREILAVKADGGLKTYTMAELSGLAQTEVTTSNIYVDQRTTFSGPTLRVILEQNGIGPDDEIKLHALNDFFINMPARDAYEYDVLLAVRMNGEEMSLRDKGPIWVIYPMDEHPELRGNLYNTRLVWQLDRIELQ